MPEQGVSAAEPSAVPAASAASPWQGSPIRLYHGSDAAIERPVVELNKGFADLGRGFYLTDDLAVAQTRARMRARAIGADAGVVSAFEFDENAVPWITLGADAPCGDPSNTEGFPSEVFGLRFAENADGFAAWMEYIRSCRSGYSALAGKGEPAVVRAWMATDEVEMVCSGFVSPEGLADLIDPSELVVQYCFRSQNLIDRHLRNAALL